MNADSLSLPVSLSNAAASNAAASNAAASNAAASNAEKRTERKRRAKKRRAKKKAKANKRRREAFAAAASAAAASLDQGKAAAATLGDQDLMLPAVLFEKILRTLGTPSDVLGRVALTSKAFARAAHGGNQLILGCRVSEFKRFQLGSTTQLMQVLKLPAFRGLTTLDFGKHGWGVPRLLSGTTTWKQLKKLCPQICSLRLGTMKKTGQTIDKIVAAFGPQLKELQIEGDFSVRAVTLSKIAAGMPNLESLSLEGTPYLFPIGRFQDNSYNYPHNAVAAMANLRCLKHLNLKQAWWMTEVGSCSDSLNYGFELLRHAGGLPALETCKLNGQRKLSPNGLANLMLACPKLQKVNITGCNPGIKGTVAEVWALVMDAVPGWGIAPPMRLSLWSRAGSKALRIVGCKESSSSSPSILLPSSSSSSSSLLSSAAGAEVAEA